MRIDVHERTRGHARLREVPRKLHVVASPLVYALAVIVLVGGLALLALALKRARRPPESLASRSTPSAAGQLSTPLPSAEPAKLRTCSLPDGPLTFLSIATEWDSSHGGLSTFNRELCAALARGGHRVYCGVPTANAAEVGRASTATVHLIAPAPVPGSTGVAALNRRRFWRRTRTEPLRRTPLRVRVRQADCAKAASPLAPRPLHPGALPASGPRAVSRGHRLADRESGPTPLRVWMRWGAQADARPLPPLPPLSTGASAGSGPTLALVAESGIGSAARPGFSAVREGRDLLALRRSMRALRYAREP